MRHSIVAFTLLAFVSPVASAPAQDLIFASPRPTFSPEPNYPDVAKAAGIQGFVAVQVQIDAGGSVTQAKALRGPTELQDSAVQAAKSWKFEPALIGGKATAVVTTVNLKFGNPPAPTPPAPITAAGTPGPGVLGGVLTSSVSISLPPPVAARPLGVVATVDGDKVIGALKWEIKEEASGKVLATGDGPVHLKDVWINETPNPTRRQTPKSIKLTDQFVIEMAEFPVPGLAEKSGFGITGRRTDTQSFSWEWFTVQDSRHAVKLQEGGELGIELKQVNGDWEVTQTEFTTDVSLRIIRMGVDPPGSPPYWRINISKGSHITWPSIANGKVSPN